MSGHTPLSGGDSASSAVTTEPREPHPWPPSHRSVGDPDHSAGWPSAGDDRNPGGGEAPTCPPSRAVPRWIALGLVAALAGFAGGRLGRPDEAAPASMTEQATQAASNEVSAGSTAASSADLSDLYERVAPSVVQIAIGNGRAQGTGSGVIIDRTGIVLTNNHVVSGRDSVRVTLSDGRRLSAEVAGRDPLWDLVVLRISDPPDDLVEAAVGDSDTVETGDTVVAIGAPFGLQGSLTAGVVSAVNRSFQGNAEYPAMRGLIQTDAAINPGNSGGPLLNTAGEAIGITTAIESPVLGSVGVGFAVPIDHAQRALPALVSGQTVQHPFLGIQGAAAAGGGVLVAAVVPGTSADAAGVRAGDAIAAIAGTPVDSIDELARALDEYRVGDRIALTVRRGGDTITIFVRLSAYQGASG